MRTQYKFSVNTPNFKAQLLQWSQQFEEVVWLDSNNHKEKYSDYDAVLAVDAFTCITTDSHQAFEKLKEYQQTTKDWIFGYLTYDLKNDVEALQSENFDGLQFPDLFFFQPKKLFLIKGDTLEMHYLKMVDDEFESDLEAIENMPLKSNSKPNNAIKIQERMTASEYLEKVNTLLDHIHRGDIYEANFCQEFYAENVEVDALSLYKDLNTISHAPFSCFFRNHNAYVLSASPERYLKKKDNQVISQPIKGTAKRSSDLHQDEQLKVGLQHNEKERSENIMIVDLVRNDLSKTALKGTVEVEELCGIYSFKQVHQMISTISSKVAAETSSVEILKTTFPMGSMTGAPKISAMQLIEELEVTKRGLYSGAIGYFTPLGDFDFNVVIRSILYNAQNKFLSYSVGSAITAKSNPMAEYEECLIKAKAMKTVLERDI